MTETPPQAEVAAADETETNARNIALVAAMVSDPRVEPLLGELVAQAVRGPDDPLASMRGLVDDVARLLSDRDAATFFVTLLAYWDDEAYTKDLLDLLPDERDRHAFAAEFGRLAARWGRLVRFRYDLTSRDPSDWKYVDVRTFYELERQQWIIEVVIEDFAQHEFKLVGPTLSYLRMVNRLLEPVVKVHELGGADLLDELDHEAISTFLDLSTRLSGLVDAAMNEHGSEDAPEGVAVAST